MADDGYQTFCLALTEQEQGAVLYHPSANVCVKPL